MSIALVIFVCLVILSLVFLVLVLALTLREQLRITISQAAAEREQLYRFAFADNVPEMLSLERMAQLPDIIEMEREARAQSTADEYADYDFGTDPLTREPQTPVGMS